MFPIARAFANEQQARDAVANLLEEGFTEDSVSLLTPSTNSAGESIPASLRDAMSTGFSLHRMNSQEINLLGDSAQAGNTLVAVEARYGESLKAQQILAKHGATQFSELVTKREPMWDPAAPFSSLLLAPTLLRGPSSARLIRGRSSAVLSKGLMFGGLPQLTKPGFSLFGNGIKRNSPAPLSSTIGWKPVSEHKEWKTSFGFPLLKRG